MTIERWLVSLFFGTFVRLIFIWKKKNKFVMITFTW
jgi:hypothetical protein